MKQKDDASPLMQSPLAEALQGQFGLHLAARLSRGSEELPHDLSERLRFARERALGVARQRHRSAVASMAPSVLAASGRSALLGGGPPSVWLRLASAFPLVVLAAGLVFIQLQIEMQQIEVAAEIDTALLADDLPPEAYGDPGFSEYLRSTVAP